MEIANGFKKTDVGIIPEDWKISSVWDLAERKKELFDDGDWVEAQHITFEGIRLIQTGNIGEGKFIEKEPKKYISKESFDTLKCKELRQGDLLICRLAEPAGRACVFPNIGDDRVITSVDVTIFRPNPKVVNRQFLNQVFTTKPWFDTVNENSGGTTHKRISRGALGKLLVPLPSLAEQTAIATALGDMDELISSLEKLIEKKKAIKQGVMQELLRPKEGWVVKKLGDIAEIVGGGTPSSFNPIYWNGDINWFTPTEVGFTKYLLSSERKVTKAGLSNSSARLLPIGTVLLTTRAGIGDLGILKIPAATNQGFQSLIAHENTDNEFLYYTLGTIKSELLRNASGSTFLEISPGKLKAIQVSLPEKVEQIRISRVLSEIDEEIDRLQNRCIKTKLLKQGMMQELLTGKRRLV